jgi:hypothetical protein
MAISRVAPIKKKKALTITSKGNLTISTSRRDVDKRNPRVYIASSSPSVPLTELKFNELTREKRKDYAILFDKRNNPVEFVNVFQQVVTQNLLQVPNVPKSQILNQIDTFITNTAPILATAINQQQYLFTPEEIVEQESDLNAALQTIQVAQTSLGDRVVSTTGDKKAKKTKPKELTKDEKVVENLLLQVIAKQLTEGKKPGTVDPSMEMFGDLIMLGEDPRKALVKSGYLQIGPGTFFNEKTGDRVDIPTNPDAYDESGNLKQP